MFEGLFGKKKVVEISPEKSAEMAEAVFRSHNSKVPKPEHAQEIVAEAGEITTPSQSSGEKVGSRRAVSEEEGWGARFEDRQEPEKSWKYHRDTSYRDNPDRPEA